MNCKRCNQKMERINYFTEYAVYWREECPRCHLIEKTGWDFKGDFDGKRKWFSAKEILENKKLPSFKSELK